MKEVNWNFCWQYKFCAFSACIPWFFVFLWLGAIPALLSIVFQAGCLIAVIRLGKSELKRMKRESAEVLSQERWK